jgi:DNA repair exonuclease SbcCD ATPase subunit
MVDGFRIQTVAIEGFKGFTTRQIIDLQGRHAFLLGKNGNGKSSIVEAVRWGLFGSTGRRNEIVANRDYPGQCRVEITLMRDGKRWNLRRTALRGITGGNDPVLTDEQGKEHLIREVMPQLDSVDAGEGMHIIFAPQAAPLRRQPEDLSTFERTVFNHLGLTHPRSLLSLVDKFLDDQQLLEDNLGKDFDNVRDEVDKKVAYLERQRGIILISPPWDGGHVPSVAETENKVRVLITEITGQPPDQSLLGISMDALIDSADDAFENRQAQDQGALEKELTAIVDRKDLLLSLHQAMETIQAKKSTIQGKQSRLKDVLGSVALDELRESVERARETADAAALRLRMVKDAISLLHRDQGKPVVCPVCEVEHSQQDLESGLERTVSQLSGDHTRDLSELENRLGEAEDLSQELERLSVDLAELEQSADDARTHIDAEDAKELPKPISTGDLDSILARHLERETSIRAQLDNQKGWFDTTQARLSKLKEEEKFHQVQKDLVGLGPSRNQLKQVEAAYQDLVSFGETVSEVRMVVAACLNERLEKDLPGVAQKLSQVFNALTRHPWYDQLTIAKDTLPKLELRVTSSHDPSGRSHSAEVLNGQAESALALVPYFAFSQADDAPTEVYLVLLDDPTRAFDEDHIDILAERLAELGNHVQLMVASQESNRFRALLPKYLKPASYLIVEPAHWSHDAGPQLSLEYA